MTAPAIQTTIDDLVTMTFPSNVVELICARFELYDLGLTVLRRMPANDDPNYTIGVIATTKTPSEDSTEIRQDRFLGATISEYVVTVYSFVKDADRARGTAAHSVMAEIVEVTLEDDPALRASLAQLQATVLGTTKKMGRRYIRQTRFLSNEVNGNHLFLSATDFCFETQKSR